MRLRDREVYEFPGLPSQIITDWVEIYSLTVLEARGQENQGVGKVMLFQRLFGRICSMPFSLFLFFIFILFFLNPNPHR